MMEDTTKNITCSVVIPVFNSMSTLEPLVQRLEKVLDNLISDYEIILVNDGSQDGSWKTIQRIVEDDEHVLGINLMRNYGQHNALLCGIRQAKFDVILTMDDDLQHPPEEAYKLFAKLTEGFDVVYGVPEVERHSFWRNITSKMIKTFLKMAMGIDSATSVSAYRLFRREIVRSFQDYEGNYVSIDVLLTWGTTKFGSVKVDYQAREKGKSNYTLPKLIQHAFTLITGYSDVPLRLATTMGFVFMFLGLVVLIYVIVNFLIHHGSVPGFAFLASIISIFSGVQLFSLGIFGEYLGRIFSRALNKPTYVVNSIIKSHGEVKY